MALPQPDLYQSLYGAGESAAGGQTATSTTIKPPTTFKPLSTSTTAPKQTWALPQPGSTSTTAQQSPATAPVPNSPVTRTGAIPAPAPYTPPRYTWPLPQPPTGNPLTEVPTPPQQAPSTPTTPTTPSTPPTGGTGGGGGFTGPARSWFDKQPDANKQKAFAIWNSWDSTKRSAFLKLSSSEQQKQLQTIMGGAAAAPAGGGGGGINTGGGGGGEGGSTSLPNIAGFTLPGEPPAWQAPDQAATGQAQNQLLLNVLQHPESMTDQGVAMLQQQQMEQILAQQQAYQQQFGQQAASRGTYGGGYTDSLNRRLSDATTGQLTQSSRDIYLQRMMQDMEDRRAALGLSDQILTGQTGRAATGHQQQLASYGAGLEKYFGGQDVLNAIRQRQMQEKLGMGALDIDKQRLTESGRQFDLGHRLNWAQLASQDELGRLDLGNDLAGMNIQRQQDLQSLLFGGGDVQARTYVQTMDEWDDFLRELEEVVKRRIQPRPASSAPALDRAYAELSRREPDVAQMDVGVYPWTDPYAGSSVHASTIYQSPLQSQVQMNPAVTALSTDASLESTLRHELEHARQYRGLGLNEAGRKAVSEQRYPYEERPTENQAFDAQHAYEKSRGFTFNPRTPDWSKLLPHPRFNDMLDSIPFSPNR